MIPLEIFLKALCPHGQFCLYDNPELLDYLQNHEFNGKLYHIEHTTAAKGPFVLWYPLEAWKNEQIRDDAINKLIAAQYPYPGFSRTDVKQKQAREVLEKQIQVAKDTGNQEMVEILQMALEQIKI